MGRYGSGREAAGGEELLRGEENGGSWGRAPARILEERGARGGKSYCMGDIGGVRDWSPARTRWDMGIRCHTTRSLEEACLEKGRRRQRAGR
jgi:hypothetical protein